MEEKFNGQRPQQNRARSPFPVIEAIKSLKLTKAEDMIEYLMVIRHHVSMRQWNSVCKFVATRKFEKKAFRELSIEELQLILHHLTLFVYNAGLVKCFSICLQKKKDKGTSCRGEELFKAYVSIGQKDMNIKEAMNMYIAINELKEEALFKALVSFEE